MSAGLEQLYANRFDAADRAWKQTVWAILWRRAFSRWVKPGDTVVDLGAGYCEFINNAVAARRIAVDLNPATRGCAQAGVEVHETSADDLRFLERGSVQVVFTSNLLEHLPDKAAVSRVIAEAARVLAPGGTFIAMGPNIRLLPGRYWDYFDHQVPLSDVSVGEAMSHAGLELACLEPRFLPYTVKGVGPRWRWLVEAYLALRPVSSRWLGKQFLAVARKPERR